MLRFLLTDLRSRISGATVATRLYSFARRPKRRQTPRLPPQCENDRAVAALPPRFTADDLTAAIAAEPNPLVCLHLLTHQHPHRSHPSASSFLITIKKLGAASLFPELRSAASLAFSFPSILSEPLLSTIIYFYSNARMLSSAIHVYNLMRDHPDPSCRPTTQTYNLLFTALLGRDNRNSYINHVYMDTLRALFRQMVNSGVAPDVFSLNSMIKGYALSLHLNDALRVFHQMKPVYGCDPDANSYNYLVHGLCAQGRTKNARELFDEMRSRAFVPSAKTFNSLASALAMGGELEAAVEIVGEMGRMVDLVTCRTVIGEMCGRGRVREGLRLLREWKERAVLNERGYEELLYGIDIGHGDDELVGRGPAL
ncbi:putative tetratricopeptide-like helical domain superfamily [Dioscorea sansibarensis]